MEIENENSLEEDFGDAARPSNSPSRFDPGFQQTGEKQCGKILAYIRNSTPLVLFSRFALDQVRVLIISEILCGAGSQGAGAGS